MQGMSYSQIREKVHVSKSTLSNWLYNRPLPDEKIRQLRDSNPKRIERCRNTKRLKREALLASVLSNVSTDIGQMNDREIFLAGLFLFWGEGGKTLNSITSLSNTDPSVIAFFIKWLSILGVKKENMRARLHLYRDMDIEVITNYWSLISGIPVSLFFKPYIKKTNLAGLSYKNGFGKGTCMIVVANKPLNDYILMGIRRLQALYSRP